jgi:hypothetical protein
LGLCGADESWTHAFCGAHRRVADVPYTDAAASVENVGAGGSSRPAHGGQDGPLTRRERTLVRCFCTRAPCSHCFAPRPAFPRRARALLARQTSGLRLRKDGPSPLRRPRSSGTQRRRGFGRPRNANGPAEGEAASVNANRLQEATAAVGGSIFAWPPLGKRKVRLCPPLDVRPTPDRDAP